jgi:hypothetical protein
MTVVAMRHAAAMLLAIVVVFGLRTQDLNLQPIIGQFDQRYFDTYTPYFPGLDKVETDEIFAPQNASKKKIVFLGASAVDSIGCDTSWVDKRVKSPNVHFSCSVSGQLNRILDEQGLTDWKSFDLARNGTKLTPMLYVYSRIIALRPEIVIWGEAFNYYLWVNADAASLTPQQYAYMDEVFNRYPDTAVIWSAYKATLERHGWIPTPGAAPVPAPDLSPKYRASTNLDDLLALAISDVRNDWPFQAPSRPLAFVPDLVNWGLRQDHVLPYPFKNDDPDFAYFQGFRIFADMQAHLGQKMFFYFTPQYFQSADPYYMKGVTEIYGGYLKMHDIPFASHLNLPLKPIYETPEGYHATVFGNRKVAAAVFHDLEQVGYLP